MIRHNENADASTSWLCRELIHEEKAAKIRYRNTFGTQRVGGFFANAFDLYLKNPANTNVVEWASACWRCGR